MRQGISTYGHGDAKVLSAYHSRNVAGLCLQPPATLLLLCLCVLRLLAGFAGWTELFLNYAVLLNRLCLGCDVIHTFSSQTKGTPVAVALFLKGLKPNLSYNRKLRSLLVLVKSTRRLAQVVSRSAALGAVCAKSIMAPSKADPIPLPCHCGSTASLPI